MAGGQTRLIRGYYLSMNTTQPTASECLKNSQQAFEQGNVPKARHWARLAVSLEPRNEEAWLWMGALASPQASIGYLRRALEINPASTRAQQGLAWARKRLAAGQMAETRPHKIHRVMAPLPVSTPPSAPVPAEPGRRPPARLNLSSALVILTVLCLAVGLLALLNTSSAQAFLLGYGTPVARQPWANVQLDETSPTPLPTDPTDGNAAALAQATDVPTSTPAPTDTAAPTATPSAAISTTVPSAPTQTVVQPASPTPLPTDTGAPTSVPAAAKPVDSAQQPASSGTGRRIVVSISQQHMWVYDSSGLVYSFVISTGMHNSMSVGTFAVQDKIPNAYGSTWDLWMPDWLGIYKVGNLENGIHALPILSSGKTLWAGLLGQPASFGCVILGTADAQTLYNWAEVGTPVIIQK